MNDGHRFTVLDIETIPCADALSMTVKGVASPRRQALHRICSVAVINGIETAEGFSDVESGVFTRDRLEEARILGCLDIVLPDPDIAGSRIITYNGTAHDLRLLRLRQASLWMFSARKLARWCTSPSGRHFDLMKVGFGGPSERWSLVDLCAGLGFPVREGHLKSSIASMVSQDRWDVVAEHNLMDVVGTFLAYGTWRSVETGNDQFAATAWTSIAGMLEGFTSVNVGHAGLSSYHLLEEARLRLRKPR